MIGRVSRFERWPVKITRTTPRCLAAGLVCGALLAVCTAGHGAAPFSPAVSGTGGSSATRVLAQWNDAFARQSRIQVSFAPANSDVGIRAMIERSADFASTEIPLSPEDLNRHDLVQFPLLIGGVVPIVNIPGVAPGRLRLTSSLLARIFLGEITSWGDDDIRASNPGLNLPKLPIRLVVRQTAASTTLALTTFLARTDRNWATRIGPNKLPAWPAPTLPVATVMAMGEKVATTPGAIGYLNFDEAYRNRYSTVQLRNKSGQFVAASREAIQKASVTAGLGKTGDHVPELIDVAGEGTWPIVEVTYVLLERYPKSQERARSTLKFFYWAFLMGDQMASDTGFVPLSSTSQARIVSRFRNVQGSDRRPIDFLG